jgi:hypothetical protein
MQKYHVVLASLLQPEQAYITDFNQQIIHHISGLIGLIKQELC